MLDKVAVLRGRAKTAFTAPSLAGVSRDRRSLDVTAVGDGDRDVLIRDQVFDGKLDAFVDDLGATLVAEIFLDLFQLVRDDAAQRTLVAEYLFEFGDQLDDAFVLFDDFLSFERGE